ncbi:MAG: NAD(P)H-quinone oxidoreductase [Fuerstiella sp.]|nr:NAD(P)H-quinone oxidoreductase [Fuerstiella sp.]
MRAIWVEDDALVWRETPTPVVRAGEVLIDIHASAVNRADLMQRRGHYPPPPGASPIPGLECAGVVAEVGDGVSRLKIGDSVCALLAGGGYAEQTVVPDGQVLPIPAGFSFEQAAAVPEVFATAWLNLFMEAGLRQGEQVLIHAGASGVGTAGIQLCRVFGNPCYVTVGNAEKLRTCIRLGASGGSIRHDGRFVEQVTAWTGGSGFDVILDPVGAAYLSDNLNSLCLNGRLVVIGLMGGMTANLDLRLLMMERLRVIGSTLRSRPVAMKTAVMDALHHRVWPLLESGEIVPVIDRCFSVTEADAAHSRMAANANTGKLILRIR